MTPDEKAIRQLIADWNTHIKNRELESVLALMTEDVVFTVVGAPPFGKAEFARTARGMQGQVESSAEILEVGVRGDTAWARVKLQVAITTPQGARTERSGYAMSVYLKQPNGSWLLARDANLLAPPAH